MSDCDICCEKYNKSSRKPITCIHCQFTSCTSCNQTYLLESVHEPHCTNCRKTWTLEFMNENFTQTFLTKEYRTKREMVYFKEEESQFPMLLPLAEQRKQINMIDEKVNTLDIMIHQNDRKEDQLVRDQREIDRTLKKEKYELGKERYIILSKDVSREKREVIMKCPMSECKGFLNSKFYCGICSSHICKECHHKKEEEKEHACNPDDVATITELNKSTKPCPNCHTRIFKTDGCDQMFCIQCHTPFSWRTGKIENGVIHNPHYFEALRAGNINHQRHQAHQGGCGPMRDARTIRLLIREFCKAEKIPELEISDELFYFYQQMVHHRAVTLPMFTRVDDREDERIKFMIGKIEEKKFKQRLYVYRKTSLRKIEEQQIMNTYVNTGEELFRSITVANIPEIICQLRMLQDITFVAVSDINKKYQHAGILKPNDIKRLVA
jgi:hypothetical protein